MRHLIDPLDFTQQEISTLLDLADRIHDDPAAYQEAASHKKLATLFYEPSTRTRLSFEAAMLNLVGHVLGFPSENVSSASKGESVADTIRVVSCYADIVAMRHPKEGAPLRAIQTIPFKIVRLHFRGRPRLPVFSGGSRFTMRFHSSSFNSYRLNIINTPFSLF